MARKLDQRSRALRRNLRKQARKGTLSSREKKDLLTQEGRFRKAARRRRPFTLGLPLLAGVGAGVGALQGGLALGDMLAGMRREKPPKGDPEQTPKVNASGEVVVDPAAPVTDPAAPVAGDGADMVPNRSTMEEYERIRAQEAADAADSELVDEEGNNLNPNLDRGYDVQQEYEVDEDGNTLNPNVERVYDVEEEDVPPPVVGGPGVLPPEARERLRRRDARRRRRQDAASDAAIELGLGGAETEGGDLEEAARQASQVDTPNPLPWLYSSPVFREMYPGEPRVATGSSMDELTRRIGNLQGAKDALRPEEGIGLGGVTDYTGGFEFGPAEDPMESLAPRPAQQLDRGASQMGGTPQSQARSQVQQAANEAARLRMEDAAARGQEYNDLLRQVREAADTLPLDEFDEPEDLFEPDVEADLLRFRNRNRALPGGFSEIEERLGNYGGRRLPRVSRRQAQPLPVDRPDPRTNTVFDPLLEDAGVQRALRGFGRRGGRRRSSFAEGGRVDKSNDLVARIKRKYGLR